MKRKTSAASHRGLAMTWVPVTTTDGRVRMEMRWTAPPTVLRRAS
jgi:hypothetical protein